ncbi:MAG: type IV pilus assembly protein PilM [Thermodesulfobacteriota bacterium]
MNYFPLFKNGLHAGLDIGAHSIKVVLLKKTRKGRFLEKSVVKEIPVDFRRGERSDNQLAKWVRELLKAVGFKKGRLVSIISSQDLNVRCISLPPMPQRELKEAVKWEMGKHLSFPPEEAKIDYWMLGRTKSDEREQVHLLVSALRKVDIDHLIALMKKAGIQLSLFTPKAGALWNAFQRAKESIPHESVGLIDLGGTKTYIMIIRRGILEFTREIPIGGRHITEAIMEVISPDETSSISRYEVAEGIKEKWGIPKGMASNGAESEVSPERVYVAIRPILERLVAEIDRSFEFYKQEFNESTVEKVYLSGGTAKLANLEEYLASGLGLPVGGFHSLFEGSSDRDVGPELIVAFGTALEERGISRRDIRFIPALRKEIMVMPLVVAFGMTAALGTYWSVDKRYKSLRRAVEQKKRLLTQLETQMRQIVPLRETREKLIKELSLYPSKLMKQPPYPEILMEISQVIPGNVTLNLVQLNGEPEVEEEKETGKRYNRYRMKVRGVIFGKGPDRIATVARLMVGMESSPLFEDVKLLSTEENNEYSEPGDGFELSCLYRTME